MYRGMHIGVVVPALNEELAIADVVNGIPAYVDQIIVVDDASSDQTAVRAREAGRNIELVVHDENRGVGAAIVTGYRRALALGIDITAVMAGDGQMDPSDLSALLDAVCDGSAEYAKGNRFAGREVWEVMPASRLLGNIALSMATKVATGCLHVFDSQCGYTAISRHALETVELGRVFPRYGYPNDLLARIAAAGLRVVDVPVRPIYGPTWHSGITPHKSVIPLSKLLVRCFMTRWVPERPTRLPETVS